MRKSPLSHRPCAVFLLLATLLVGSAAGSAQELDRIRSTVHASQTSPALPSISLHFGRATATWIARLDRGTFQPRRDDFLFAPLQREAALVAYVGSEVILESTSTETSRQDDPPGAAIASQLSRLARFSYRPAPGVTLGLSRGTWSSLDRLLVEGNIRRTTLTLSHEHRITGGEWRTALAWGRTSPREGEAFSGYLAETSLRFNGAHVAFARFEEVGADNAPLGWFHRENDTVDKLSIGYYQDMYRSRGGMLGLGLVGSRYHAEPSARSPAGLKARALFLFARIRLH